MPVSSLVCSAAHVLADANRFSVTQIDRDATSRKCDAHSNGKEYQ